jgi:hypothetical protein
MKVKNEENETTNERSERIGRRNKRKNERKKRKNKKNKTMKDRILLISLNCYQLWLLLRRLCSPTWALVFLEKFLCQFFEHCWYLVGLLGRAVGQSQDTGRHNTHTRGHVCMLVSDSNPWHSVGAVKTHTHTLESAATVMDLCVSFNQRH